MTDYSMIVMVAIVAVVASGMLTAAVFLIDRNVDRHDQKK